MIASCLFFQFSIEHRESKTQQLSDIKFQLENTEGEGKQEREREDINSERKSEGDKDNGRGQM